MADLVNLLVGVAVLTTAAVTTYFVIKDLLPKLENLLSRYTGDEDLAELFTKFGVLYIGLVGAKEIANGLQRTNIRLAEDLGNIAFGAFSSALRIVGSLKWFIWIGVLVFIGYSIFGLRNQDSF